MKLETAKRLEEAADALGISLSVYEDYSGRCMYGRTTTGVVLGNPADFPAVAAETVRALFAETHPGDESTDDSEAMQLISDLRGMRSDDMGRGVIYY